MAAQQQINQSEFVQDAPLHQPLPQESTQQQHSKERSSVAPESETPQKPAGQKKKIPTKAIILAVPLVLIVLLFVAVQIKNRQQPQTPAPALQPGLTEPAQKVDRNPLQQRIDALKTELQQAEPTKQELSFPPVAQDLSLEKQ